MALDRCWVDAVAPPQFSHDKSLAEPGAEAVLKVYGIVGAEAGAGADGIGVRFSQGKLLSEAEIGAEAEALSLEGALKANDVAGAETGAEPGASLLLLLGGLKTNVMVEDTKEVVGESAVALGVKMVQV